MRQRRVDGRPVKCGLGGGVWGHKSVATSQRVFVTCMLMSGCAPSPLPTAVGADLGVSFPLPVEDLGGPAPSPDIADLEIGPAPFGTDAGRCVAAAAPPICTPGPGIVHFLPSFLGPKNKGPVGIAIGDLNGDGLGDIAISYDVSGELGVYYNRGDGSFSNERSYRPVEAGAPLVIRDLNGDQRPDVIATSGAGTFDVLLNTGQDLSAPIQYGDPCRFDGCTGFGGDFSWGSLSVGDLNCDGSVDVALWDTFFLNRGNGAFLPGVLYSASPWRLTTVGDVDGDGWPDVLGTGGLTTDHVTVGVALSHEGRFDIQSLVTFPTDQTTQTKFRSFASGDFNRDGNADVVLCADFVMFAGFGSQNKQLDHFSKLRTIYSGGHVEVSDVDRDGNPDVLVEDKYELIVLYGLGDGSFKTTETKLHIFPRWTVGDLDGDCWPDIVSADNLSGTIDILHNHRDGTFTHGP